MTRHAAAVVVVACLSSIVFPALPALCAQSTQLQSTQFKIGSEPADVHKSPSTGSPVIGKAARGAVRSGRQPAPRHTAHRAAHWNLKG